MRPHSRLAGALLGLLLVCAPTANVLTAGSAGKRHAFVTLASQPLHLSHAAVLFQSLREVNSTANLVLLAFDNVTDTQGILGPDVVIVNTTHPVPFAELPPPFRALYGASGPWDMVKLRTWQLTQYERVAFLDGDLMAVANPDALFDFPGFAFCDGPFSPLNSGMFVTTPSEATYQDLVSELRVANFTVATGWSDTGHLVPAHYASPKVGLHYGSKSTQGLLHYFFVLRTRVDSALRNREGAALQLPRHVWNFQVPSDTNDSTAPVRLVHFTGCGKPQKPVPDNYTTCMTFHRRWVETEARVRARLQGMGRLR